jgi:hypothetical protein
MLAGSGYNPMTTDAAMTFQQRHSDPTGDKICGRYTKIKVWEKIASIPANHVAPWQSR